MAIDARDVDDRLDPEQLLSLAHELLQFSVRQIRVWPVTFRRRRRDLQRLVETEQPRPALYAGGQPLVRLQLLRPEDTRRHLLRVLPGRLNPVEHRQDGAVVPERPTNLDRDEMLQPLLRPLVHQPERLVEVFADRLRRHAEVLADLLIRQLLVNEEVHRLLHPLRARDRMHDRTVPTLASLRGQRFALRLPLRISYEVQRWFRLRHNWR